MVLFAASFLLKNGSERQPLLLLLKNPKNRSENPTRRKAVRKEMVPFKEKPFGAEEFKEMVKQHLSFQEFKEKKNRLVG